MMKELVPNMMVPSVDDAIRYYRDTLGFELAMANPSEAPHEWAMLSHGGVSVMLQSRDSLVAELPAFADRAPGAGCTFFITMQGVEDYHRRVKDSAHVLVEPHKTPYGATEFVVEDPNGYVLYFAEFPEEE